MRKLIISRKKHPKFSEQLDKVLSELCDNPLDNSEDNLTTQENSLDIKENKHVKNTKTK